MNKTVFPAMVSVFILIMAISAIGQGGFGPSYGDSNYGDVQYDDVQFLPERGNFNDAGLGQFPEYYDNTVMGRDSDLQQRTVYQTAAPSGAPLPIAPSSPDILGLNIPAESTVVDYREASGSLGAEDSLIGASDFAPTDFAAAGIDDAYNAEPASALGQQRKATSSIGYTYPSSSKAVVSEVVKAKNKLYVSYVPQTTGGCKLFGWQPMWLQISSSGPVWFYEWYPNGELRVKYLGYSSAGWNKKWFNGDVPGWHILQYYCNGWSNYIYIYVFSSRPTDQELNIPAPASGTSSVTLRSSWLSGYDVYLDGNYMGTEGFGRDLSDGIYRFNVPGDMWHSIVIIKDGKSYWETGTFLSGAAYRFTI